MASASDRRGSPDARWLVAVSGSIYRSVDRDEFDDWYDNIHLPQITQCPGFRWGVRYEAPEGSNPHAFLTLYEVDGPEALETEEFRARRGWGPFTGKVEFVTHLLKRRIPEHGGVPW